MFESSRTGGKRLCARFRDCVRYCVRDIACNKSICVVSAVGLWFERSCRWRLGSICAASAFRDCARACGCVRVRAGV